MEVNQQPLRVLHLEDSLEDAIFIQRHLRLASVHCEITRVDSEEDYLQALAQEWDLILADYILPAFDGLSALAIAVKMSPHTPLIFLSGALGEDVAVEALKRGATDYVIKDRLSRLVPAMLRAINEAQERREHLRVEKELKETRQQLQLAVEIAKLGSWDWEIGTNVVRFSPEWKKLLGYEPSEIKNHFDEWASRIHAEERELALEAMFHFISAPSDLYETEMRLQHKGGEYCWMAMRAVPVMEQGKITRLVGTHLDITARRQAEENARQAALHDSLTGLPNRALLYELAEKILASMLRRKGMAAIFFIDLDHFKPINDLYGHRVGDEVLKQVAQRIVRCLRHEDVTGRVGGDEFVVALSFLASPDDAAHVAANIVANLSAPFHVGGREIQLSGSLGISLFPVDGTDVDTLIRNADIAMYHAKDFGRNHFRFFCETTQTRGGESPVG